MLKDRRRGPAGTDDELTPESTVADLLTHWIATCRADTALARTNGARPCKTEDTLDAYARVIDKVLILALRAVRLGELTTQRVDPVPAFLHSGQRGP